MKWIGWPSSVANFVDTPNGILTDSGNWYRTRVQLLRDYAGPVLEHEPLERLLAQSDAWLRTPRSLAVWLLPPFLVGMPPVQAALAMLCVFFIWQALGPSFVSRRVLPIMRALDAVALQALWYAWMMTQFARSAEYSALAVGLGGFVCLRWGVIGYIMRPVVKWLWSALYRMPVADQVLRAFIVRAALHHGITLADFANMEQEILQHLSRK